MMARRERRSKSNEHANPQHGRYSVALSSPPNMRVPLFDFAETADISDQHQIDSST
jgi:hypothetical protein